MNDGETFWHSGSTLHHSYSIPRNVLPRDLRPHCVCKIWQERCCGILPERKLSQLKTESKANKKNTKGTTYMKIRHSNVNKALGGNTSTTAKNLVVNCEHNPYAPRVRKSVWYLSLKFVCHLLWDQLISRRTSEVSGLLVRLSS